MMLFTRNHNGRLLRCGVTTGACAAAAAKAATKILLTGEALPSVSLVTPGGVALTLDLAGVEQTESFVRCAVQKDSGDDPDVTNGVLIYATVRRTEAGLTILGGEGVGRVTKPGLDQPVGEAAINSVPRRMIREAVNEVRSDCGYGGGLSVTVSVPGGEALAKSTFNPRMGVIGGISIIGTTGIVEPMSNRALIDTLRIELKQLAGTGTKSLLLTPGNYGETFAREKLGLSLENHVVCSNFIGGAIDAAVELGFRRILLIGHIGKLVKLGIGMTNTHSSNGDGRMETLIACALKAGAEVGLLHAISECVTTDAALSLLREAGLLWASMAQLNARVGDCLSRRVPAGVEVGFVCFTNAPEPVVLFKSADAEALMKIWRNQP